MPDYSQQIRDDWARQAAASGRPLAFDPKTGSYTSLAAFQQANPTDPYGGRAPQKLSDFQIGANGLPMVVTPADAFGPAKVRYFPKEYFDASGNYIGPNPNSPDWQASGSYFRDPLQWNYTEGKFEKPTNWEHVVGTAMAVGGGAAGLAQAGGAGLLGGGAGLGGGGGAAAAGGGLALATPLINAGAGLISTHLQTSANEDASQRQADATKYAADLKAKADADQLAYLKQQSAYNAMVAESTRAANYGQWAAKQTQLGSVGQALGLPARAIPAYVPLPPDASLAPPVTAPPTGTAPAPPAATPPVAPAGTPPAATPPAVTPGAGTPDAGTSGTTTPNPAAWWNPQDPRGSVAALFAGATPTSQAILDRKAQIEAAGGQISPANAEGVISKIYVPGVGWTRVLDGGTAGGPGGATGTGWTFVPQGGGAPTRTSAQTLTAPADPFGTVGQYLLDPKQAGGTLTLPRYQPFGQPGGPVGSYL